MKAMTYARYGGPDDLTLADLDTPVPKAGEVLVRVRATSLNSWDWDLLRGKPFLVRVDGLFSPPHPILGADVAGIVEAVGPDAQKFKPGDAVFGDLCEAGWGGLAEYVAVRETALTKKPEPISFEAAAATPQAALLAWQGLNFRGGIKPGESVLINGAGGGVGTFAIQFAKRAGAVVTGVDHGMKFDTMRKAGADHVIDYTVEDFAAHGQRYDLILDMVARRPLAAYRRALTPTGTLAVIGGTAWTILQVALAGLSKSAPQRIGLVIYRPNTTELDEVGALIAAGEIAPFIDRVYPLAEAADAFRQLGAGEVLGKVVITP